MFGTYIKEHIPPEWHGRNVDEVDLEGWLNSKRFDEGKQFCGFIPGPRGMIIGVIFFQENQW